MAKEKVKIDNPFINDVEVLFLLQALQEIASNMEKRLNMNMEDELYFVFRKQYTSLYPN